MVDALEAVKLEMLREKLAVSVLCFPLKANNTLVPASVSELNVAAPAVSVLLSMVLPSQWRSRVATRSRPGISAVHVMPAIES